MIGIIGRGPRDPQNNLGELARENSPKGPGRDPHFQWSGAPGRAGPGPSGIPGSLSGPGAGLERAGPGSLGLFRAGCPFWGDLMA
jgi:hypothetical protein